MCYTALFIDSRRWITIYTNKRKLHNKSETSKQQQVKQSAVINITTMFHYLRCILVTFCVMSYVGCTSIDAIPPPPLAHVMNCGSTDEMVGECSNDLPEHLIDFLQNFRIDISKEDILTKCE